MAKASETYTFTFYEDGSLVRGEYVNGTYEIINCKLKLDIVDNNPGVPPDNRVFTVFYDYYFSDGGQTLTIVPPIDGGLILTRQ